MSSLQRVKPAPGQKVRFEDPRQGHIPADGAEVPLTKYYRRRLAVGDLLPAERPRKPKQEG